MDLLRILVVDDHAVVRHSIRSLLESVEGWSVCGEAENGEEAIVFARDQHPDVVVMDLMMPRRNGLEATRQIVTFAPKTPVLIVTLFDNPALSEHARKVGARGFLRKADSGSQLIPAIRHVLTEDSFFVVHHDFSC